MFYKIPLIEGIGGCVCKLWYGNKYVISKCKTLWRFKQNIEINLGYFIKNTPLARRDDNLYYHFFMYIIDNPQQDFKIEILFQSENPYQLLKTEFLELSKAKSDPQCLNNHFEPYVPKNTNRKGSGSWINKGYYLNFMQWKKKYSNRTKIQ